MSKSCVKPVQTSMRNLLKNCVRSSTESINYLLHIHDAVQNNQLSRFFTDHSNQVFTHDILNYQRLKIDYYTQFPQPLLLLPRTKKGE